jgi:hypothetical protein
MIKQDLEALSKRLETRTLTMVQNAESGTNWKIEALNSKIDDRTSTSRSGEQNILSFGRAAVKLKDD